VAKAEIKADSELMQDVNHRIKNLIDRNREVTKKYSAKAQAFLVEAENLDQKVNTITQVDSDSAGQVSAQIEEEKKGASELSGEEK